MKLTKVFLVIVLLSISSSAYAGRLCSEHPNNSAETCPEAVCKETHLKKQGCSGKEKGQCSHHKMDKKACLEKAKGCCGKPAGQCSHHNMDKAVSSDKAKGCCGKPEGQCSHHKGNKDDMGMGYKSHHPDLSPAKKKAIKKVSKSFHRQKRGLLSQLKREKKALTHLLAAPDSGVDDIANAEANVIAVQGELVRLKTQYKLNMKSILGPEVFEKYMKHHDRHSSKRRGIFARFKERFL